MAIDMHNSKQNSEDDLLRDKWDREFTKQARWSIVKLVDSVNNLSSSIFDSDYGDGLSEEQLEAIRADLLGRDSSL